MVIIPVINCKEESCVRERIAIAEKLACEWVHIDVADGIFAPVLLWKNAEDFKSAIGDGIRAKIEVHLMVSEPEKVLRDWIAVGAKRIIIHAESHFDFSSVKEECDAHGVELGISIMAHTDVRTIDPFLSRVSFFQVLSVLPGFSGGVFNNFALSHISYIRAKTGSDVRIEVDGGIDADRARQTRDAGCDIATSSTFIFSSHDPNEALSILKNS